MGPSAAVQHVRHIAVQGLPSRMAVAAMIDAMDGVMPSRTCTFIWADDDGLPCDTYDRSLIPEALDEFIHHSPRLAADPHAPSLDKMLHSPDEFGGWRRFLNFPDWEKSLLKNVIFKPYGIGNNLDFPIRDSMGRSRAVLTFGREPGSSAYSRREVEAVLSLRSHFLHAMDCAAALDEAETCAPDSEIEVVLVAPDGSITSATREGTFMLYQLKPQTSGARRIACEVAPPPVIEVMRRLHSAGEGTNALPPNLTVSTAWGRFKVIAHALASGGDTVVTLQRLVPRHLRRLRRVAGFDLSPREREVALAMCASGNGDFVAMQAGLSVASYREYARRIYARLGVNGRGGVRELLDS